MADNTAPPRLLELIELLEHHQVEFILIGGLAAVLHGAPIATYDIDICYARSAKNLDRLAGALRELQPTLRGAPPDLPFRLDAESLALGSNFTFSTVLGPLDLLGYVEPLGTYENLLIHADLMDLNKHQIRVISLDDLLTIKRYIGRPKDRAALDQLEAIRRLRDS